MLRAFGTGAVGGMFGFGAAALSRGDPWTFLQLGALAGFVLPSLPRGWAILAAAVASGASAFLFDPPTPIASALLFAGLVFVAEVSRHEDEPRTPWAEKWAPAIGWCAAVLLFFGALGLRDRIGADPTFWAATVAFALPWSLIAWRVRAFGPIAAVSVFAAGIALFGPRADALALGLLFAALLPLVVWCVPHVLRVRRERMKEVGLAGTFFGRLSSDVCTCGGAGYTPRGSGTIGAVTALPIGWWLSSFGPVGRAVAIVLLTAVSFVVAYRYCAGGTEDLDPSEVVYDEFIGVLIALAVVPWEWPWVVAAFVLFRFFDIAKPGPVGLVDRKMKTPAGIMLDDVIAGVLAAAVLLVARAVIA